MTTWREAELGDVATLQRGFDLPARLRRSGQVPIVSSSGVSGWHDRAMVKAPGVVTGRYGTIGEVFFEDTDFWPLNTTLWVSDFHGNDERFIYYMLNRVDYATHSGKSGVPGVNRNDLHRETVQIPDSPAEQQTIARALTDADDLITTLERLITKKQAIKQGMMQQLLTGRTRLPGFETEWKWQPFSEVMKRLNSQRHQVMASSYSEVGLLPVVDQGQKEIIGYTDEIGRAVDPGDEGVIVFGDHTCITKFVDYKFLVGADGTQLVQAIAGNLTEFFSYALQSDPVISTGYNRHFKQLREKIFPVPDISEQRAIAAVLRNADFELNMLLSQLEKARCIKTGMLQQLLTGRTRLSIEVIS